MWASDLEVTVVGDGPPVVFVHGSVVGADRTWRQQLPLADRATLRLPNRPGFGASPPLERGDFEAEAPLFAELLGDGAHLVGHSYGGGDRAARRGASPRGGALAHRLGARCLRVAAGNPAVDEMLANGERLFGHAPDMDPQEFLALFRAGAHSAHDTPEELPDWLERGARLVMAERPPWEAEIPLDALGAPRRSPSS